MAAGDNVADAGEAADAGPEASTGIGGGGIPVGLKGGPFGEVEDADAIQAEVEVGGERARSR